MIQQFRRRIIFTTMLIAAAILAAILVGMAVINTAGTTRDADSLLALLQQNDGRFPQRERKYRWEEAGAQNSSPELPFETRYFSVLLNEDGTTESHIDRIAAVNGEEAADMGRRAAAGRYASGYIGSYRYAVDRHGSKTRVIFVDCGRRLSRNRSVLFSSAACSLAGLTVVFVLSLLFSRHLARPIAESYDKQKRFISDAGHELRTPLTIIAADNSLLEADDPQNQWVGDIKRQTQRMSRLINQLISLSKMDDEGLRGKADFPLSELLTEYLPSLTALVEASGRTLDCSLQEGVTLFGSEDSILKLVDILADNAIKYSPQGSTVHIRMFTQKGRVHVTCANPAEGWDTQNIDTVFERFYRGTQARAVNPDGFGIGLSTARAIAQAHGGRIGAKLQDGIFTVDAVLS